MRVSMTVTGAGEQNAKRLHARIFNSLISLEVDSGCGLDRLLAAAAAACALRS